MVCICVYVCVSTLIFSKLFKNEDFHYLRAIYFPAAQCLARQYTEPENINMKTQVMLAIRYKLEYIQP